jgi:hypothetical protein
VKARTGLIAATLVAGLFAAGCGSDDSKSEADEPKATPQQAIAEIGEVRTGLDQALETYRNGDAQKAAEQVGDTYLQHFEIVEGPLEDADEPLNEKLEDAIREELRGKMNDDAPVSEVEQLHEQISADLDKAEAALR